jgi:hypothetical protein
MGGFHDIREDILYGSIHLKFQNRQEKSIRIVATWSKVMTKDEGSRKAGMFYILI